MEKRTPHRKLSLVKELVKANKVRATASAFNGASELGIFTLSGMCEVVLSLTMANFDKSMTTHADHRIWQDVYKVVNQNGSDIYLKLTVIEDVLIVSFKEL
jgi:motility quorum-sensing regulator/GCU-specific mRNA interferase toxin